MRKPHHEYVTVEFVHSYDVTLWHEESGVTLKFEDVTRRRAAELLRNGRKRGLTVQLVHFDDWKVRSEEMCFGCLARPVTWEYDCDGLLPTASCDSDQCDWWASVRARETQTLV
ncbi:hypothetical protein [Streptomyces sp. NPDC006879]|uniref:hypothetical protein n=1 Tax=Streptomyces sp. NPDC006879 TaxID=3364767 RepID=UPI0036CB4BC5